MTTEAGDMKLMGKLMAGLINLAVGLLLFSSSANKRIFVWGC